MVEKERGRLLSIQSNGSESVPFVIKRDKLLIGRNDNCGIRIYIDGVAPEHCIISFSEEGRGFIEPVNKNGLTFLNGESIERQVSLEHDDVITIVKRNFRFKYPSTSKFFQPPQPAVQTSDASTTMEFEDFDPEVCLNKDMLEKRVTFGPRLSPEEFDKRMPPASPIRRGSIPGDKLKAHNVGKSPFRKNLFKGPTATTSSTYKQISAEFKMPESTVVLHRCTDISTNQFTQEKSATLSRPLFSEIVKKSVVNPPQSVTNLKQLPKQSPQKLTKKRALKLQDLRKSYYKSPKRPVHPRILAVGSTGHANSPETIVIRKKRYSPYPTKRKSVRLMHDRRSAGAYPKDNLFQRSDDGGNILPLTRDLNQESLDTVTNERNEIVHSGTSENYTPGRKKSVGTPASRKSVGTPASRKSVGTPASRKSVGTPAGRKSISTPASRKSISTPASRKSVGTPASRKSIRTPASRKSESNMFDRRKSLRNTPAREKSFHTPAKKSQVEASVEETENFTPSQKIKQSSTQVEEPVYEEITFNTEENGDEVEYENRDEMESESSNPPQKSSHVEFFDDEISVNSEESDENDAQPSASSLVSAINNVAQIGVNSIDKSMKDIHNAVQVLSHSDVSSLGNANSSDMCTNAVKKLALTISMVSAFHTYNRIIEDVSFFPFPLPSTSYETSRGHMKCITRSSAHQNEDEVARISFFEEIMRNFFTDPKNYDLCKRYARKTSEDESNSTVTQSPVLKRKSRSSKIVARNEVALKAIDSGSRTPRQTGISETITQNKVTPNSASSRHSLRRAHSSTHSPSQDSPLHQLSISDDSHSEKNEGAESFARRKSTRKSDKVMQSPLTSPTGKILRGSMENKSVEDSRTPKRKSHDAYSKMIKSKLSSKKKLQKIPLVDRKLRASKNLKVKKREQNHRSSVLKKVNFSVLSSRYKKLEGSEVNQSSAKPSLVITTQSTLHKPIINRLSQQILKKARTRKNIRVPSERIKKLIAAKVLNSTVKITISSKKKDKKKKKRSSTSSVHKRKSLSLNMPVPHKKIIPETRTSESSNRKDSNESPAVKGKAKSNANKERKSQSPSVRDPSSQHYQSNNRNEHENEKQLTAGDWSERISSSGKKYYYNSETEVSQWEKPKELRERQQNLSRLSYDSNKSEDQTRDRKSNAGTVKSNIKAADSLVFTEEAQQITSENHASPVKLNIQRNERKGLEHQKSLTKNTTVKSSRTSLVKSLRSRRNIDVTYTNSDSNKDSESPMILEEADSLVLTEKGQDVIPEKHASPVEIKMQRSKRKDIKSKNLKSPITKRTNKFKRRSSLVKTLRSRRNINEKQASFVDNKDSENTRILEVNDNSDKMAALKRKKTEDIDSSTPKQDVRKTRRKNAAISEEVAIDSTEEVNDNSHKKTALKRKKTEDIDSLTPKQDVRKTRRKNAAISEEVAIDSTEEVHEEKKASNPKRGKSKNTRKQVTADTLSSPKNAIKETEIAEVHEKQSKSNPKRRKGKKITSSAEKGREEIENENLKNAHDMTPKHYPIRGRGKQTVSYTENEVEEEIIINGEKTTKQAKTKRPKTLKSRSKVPPEVPELISEESTTPKVSPLTKKTKQSSRSKKTLEGSSKVTHEVSEAVTEESATPKTVSSKKSKQNSRSTKARIAGSKVSSEVLEAIPEKSTTLKGSPTSKKRKQNSRSANMQKKGKIEVPETESNESQKSPAQRVLRSLRSRK